MDAVLARTTRRQRGAYALEFALAFPILFLLIYALLTFGLIMTAQQALNYAAETGARAALMAPTQGLGVAARKDIATLSAAQQISWLSSWVGAEQLQVNAELLPADNRLQVTVVYHYAQAPLMPMLGPQGMFALVVPERLSSQASVNLQVAGVLAGEGLHAE